LAQLFLDIEVVINSLLQHFIAIFVIDREQSALIYYLLSSLRTYAAQENIRRVGEKIAFIRF